MEGLQPKDQEGTCQLISVNVKCATSAGVSMIVGRLLKTRAHLPAVFFFAGKRYSGTCQT